MNDENLKPQMSSGAFLPASKVPPPGIYLLYVNGDGVDFEKVQQLVGAFPHYVLGPLCWLVRPPQQEIQSFSDAVSLAMPSGGDRAEVLLCHLSGSSIFHNNEAGWGLVPWLVKNTLSRT